MNAVRSGFLSILAVSSLWWGTGQALAGDRADAQATLADAISTVEDIRADPNFFNHFSGTLDQARAVLVIPSFYKVGLFVGGSYGNAVLMVRNNAGEWSAPAFYQVAGGSLGLQIGGQSSHMLFMIMSSKGLDAILNDRFKVGANLGVTFITGGAAVETDTTSNLNQDIIAFATASGAFGGAAIDGSAITVRDDWDTAVYGANASPKAILFDRRYPPSELSRNLAALLSRRAAVAPQAPTQSPAPASQPGMAQPQNATPIYPANPPDQGGGQPTPITPLQKQPL
jgi:lipid-binding SYLF domain-containing protein